MLTRYLCDQQYPFGFGGVMSRTGLCWRCWIFCRRFYPPDPVGGVVAHEQIATCCCSVAVVSVEARFSFVNVVLLLLNTVTDCRSATVDVSRFARDYACFCCISSRTAALACPTLLSCTCPGHVPDVSRTCPYCPGFGTKYCFHGDTHGCLDYGGYVGVTVG